MMSIHITVLLQNTHIKITEKITLQYIICKRLITIWKQWMESAPNAEQILKTLVLKENTFNL